MSAGTKLIMDAAIEAHLADEGAGDMMTGYALIMVGQDLVSGDSTYFKVFGEGQPFDRSLGLAKYLLMSTEADAYDE